MKFLLIWSFLIFRATYAYRLFKPSISICRMKINKIDHQIYDCLLQRMELSREIGKMKKEENNPVLDETREKELWNHLLLEKKGLPNELVEKIWTEILEESKRIQKI